MTMILSFGSWWPVVKHTWDPADYILTVEGSCNL